MLRQPKAFLLAAAVSAFAWAGQAWAQDWPSRPVTMVVGFGPGGANGNVTRLLADALSQRLGQRFIVDHRPGAAGRRAANSVVASAPDGYTFFMGAPGILVLADLMFRDVHYKTEDFAPVALVGRLPYVLMVNKDLPVKSVPELVAYLKASPGKANHGSTGTGPIMLQELFALRTGTKFENILYQGSADALQDLLRGDTQFMFDLIPGVKGQIDSGQVRAIAVSSPKRSIALPNLPTVKEAGVDGVDATNWFGIVAAAKTPPDIVSKMAKEIVAIVNEPEFNKRLVGLGVEPMPEGPAEFSALIKQEKVLWSEVAKAANIVPK